MAHLSPLGPVSFPMQNSQQVASSNPRQKVGLLPGHGALDWAQLSKSGTLGVNLSV
jgi:hypothetical protein